MYPFLYNEDVLDNEFDCSHATSCGYTTGFPHQKFQTPPFFSSYTCENMRVSKLLRHPFCIKVFLPVNWTEEQKLFYKIYVGTTWFVVFFACFYIKLNPPPPPPKKLCQSGTALDIPWQNVHIVYTLGQILTLYVWLVDKWSTISFVFFRVGVPINGLVKNNL